MLRIDRPSEGSVGRRGRRGVKNKGKKGQREESALSNVAMIMRRTISGGYTAKGAPGGEILQSGGRVRQRGRKARGNKMSMGRERGGVSRRRGKFMPKGCGSKEGIVLHRGRNRERGVLSGRSGRDGRVLSMKDRVSLRGRFLSRGRGRVGGVLCRGRDRDRGL